MGRRIRRVPPSPFVKWAGGKRSLVHELMKHVPDEMNAYFEPFLGGGALFFALASERLPRFKKAYLTDINERLMRTFFAVATDSQKVLEELRIHVASDSEKYYAKQRARDIDRCKDTALAAWFIYMNRACFNGLYRVNKAGIFNVPRGVHKSGVNINERNILRCAVALGDVQVATKPFTYVERAARRGDFVYFDPPYYPLNKTSNFVAYGIDGFGDKEHVKLRDLALHLKRIGARVLISNSSADRVQELYGGGLFKIYEVQAARSINSRAHLRGKITDLLIT